MRNFDSWTECRNHELNDVNISDDEGNEVMFVKATREIALTDDDARRAFGKRYTSRRKNYKTSFYNCILTPDTINIFYLAARDPSYKRTCKNFSRGHCEWFGNFEWQKLSKKIIRKEKD